MSGQQAPPPQRAAPPAAQSQPVAASGGGQPAPLAPAAPPANAKTRTAEKPAVELGEAKSTAGRAGERALAVQWHEIWIGAVKSARFTVRTSAGNALEVQLEQQHYLKRHGGVGSLETDIVPAAPAGTPGKLVARDTVTGEVLEQPWVWRDLGSSFWQQLVSMFKRWFG